MPAKQVSQETFDSVVREAIDDFGLSEQEALEDAKEQLIKAGVVDFSNIVTSIAADQADDHPAVRFVSSLQKSSAANTNILRDFVTLTKHYHDVIELVGVAGARGAVELVAHILRQGVAALESAPVGHANHQIICAACDTITALCGKNELNRMRFVKCVPDSIVHLRKAVTLSEHALKEELEYGNDLAYSTLCAVRSVQRCSENVKIRFASASTLDHLLSIVHLCVLGVNGSRIVRAACSIFRQLLSSDDTTVSVSETFNRARVLSGETTTTGSGLCALAGEHTLLTVILEVLRTGNDLEITAVSEALGAARSCAISDEICKNMVEMGYDEEAEALLKRDELALIRSAVGLLKNLAARDDCKTSIARCVSTIATAVRGKNDVALSEHFCGLLASLSLRRPDLAKQFADDGYLELVVGEMNKHNEVAVLLRAGCHAIRNTASRDEHARMKTRGIPGVEKLLRHVMVKFPALCDGPGYDALRDLDFLALEEMRRDTRYNLPAEILDSKPSR